jgi:hypothetical protein
MRHIVYMLTAAMFLSLCYPGAATYALTPEQCQVFAVGGRNAICHATESVRMPYVLLHLSEQACIEGHSGHPEDFVSLDGSCQAICLPPGVPCDATLPCCDAAACTNGICSTL